VKLTGDTTTTGTGVARLAAVTLAELDNPWLEIPPQGTATSSAVVSGSIAKVNGATVDLTAEGTADWIQFPWTSAATSTGGVMPDHARKAGGSSLLTSPVYVTAVNGATNDFQIMGDANLKWTSTDTDPDHPAISTGWTSSSDHPKVGLIRRGIGNGIEFSVDPGDGEQRLNVYFGAYLAEGKVEVLVNDTVEWFGTFADTSSGEPRDAFRAAIVLDTVPGDVVKVRMTRSAMANVNSAAALLGATLSRAKVTSASLTKVNGQTVDLTAEGGTDWIQFSGSTPTAGVMPDYARKAGGSALTGPAYIDTVTANADYEIMNSANLTWTAIDADPDHPAISPGWTSSSSHPGVGLMRRGVGNGVEFTVDPGTGPQQLDVYLGAYRGTGRIEVVVNGTVEWSAPVVDTSSNEPRDAFKAAIVLNAAPGDTVRVRVTVASVDGNMACVALLGATLAPVAAPLPAGTAIEAERFLHKSPGRLIQIESNTSTVVPKNLGYGYPGAWVSYPVDVEEPGIYQVTFEYASDSAKNPSMVLTLDGRPVGQVPSFAAHEGWSTWLELSTQITMTAGVHALKWAAASDVPNMRTLSFVKVADLSDVAALTSVSPSLVVDNTAKTVRLGNFTAASIRSVLRADDNGSYVIVEADGTTPVTSGRLVPGQKIVVTSSDWTATETYTVIAGAAASVRLGVSPVAVAAGETVGLSAKTYDADGNLVEELLGSAVEYASSGPDDVILDGAFTPTVAGPREITATAGGLVSAPVTVTVNPGAASEVRVVAPVMESVVGIPVTLAFASYDEFGNHVAVVSASDVTVSSSEVTDTFDAATSSVSVTKPGQRTITVTVAGLMAGTVDLSFADTFVHQVVNELVGAIAGARAVFGSEAQFTAESWAELVDAVHAGQVLVDANATDVAAIQAATSAIHAKVAGLVPRPSVVSDAALRALVTATGSRVSSDYTPESWSVFASARSAAEALVGDTTATQDQVDAAVAALQTAVTGLMRAPVPVTKDALAAMETVALTHVEAEYTVETWAPFALALAEVQRLSSLATATQIDVDAAVTQLQTTMAGLVRVIPPAVASKAALEAVLGAVARLDETRFTAESWKALAQAVTRAQIVVANPSASQGEVNAAVTALLGAWSTAVVVTKTEVRTEVKTERVQVPVSSQDTPPIAAPKADAVTTSVAVSGVKFTKGTRPKVTVTVNVADGAVRGKVAIRVNGKVVKVVNVIQAKTVVQIPVKYAKTIKVRAKYRPITADHGTIKYSPAKKITTKKR
jgi:hypothetical protein